MPEPGVISRTTTTVSHTMKAGPGGIVPMGGNLQLQAVESIRKKHISEKQELNELNNRFSSYLERVRFLESQNKKLLQELNDIRNRWGEETRRIKTQMEPELREARARIDDTTREKAESEIRAKRAEYDANQFKRRYDEIMASRNADRQKIQMLDNMLNENEAEMDLLRKQMQDVDKDIQKYREEEKRLMVEIERLANELDAETLMRVQLENEKQTLEEEIPFRHKLHEIEMNELRALQTGSGIDPSQFYKHELERAIREIRQDFDALNQAQKAELEEWYRIKIQETIVQQERQKAIAEQSKDLVKMETNASSLRTALTDTRKEISDYQQTNADLIARIQSFEDEFDRCRRDNQNELNRRENEIEEIRMKLQQLMDDYDALMSTKTDLEFEIKTYRRLLESEESRQQQREMDMASGGGGGGGGMSSTTTKTYQYSSTSGGGGGGGGYSSGGMGGGSGMSGGMGAGMSSGGGVGGNSSYHHSSTAYHSGGGGGGSSSHLQSGGGGGQSGSTYEKHGGSQHGGNQSGGLMGNLPHLANTSDYGDNYGDGYSSSGYGRGGGGGALSPQNGAGYGVHRPRSPYGGEDAMGGGQVGTEDGQFTSQPMKSKTTYQRSAKGPVSISECAPNGNFIVLENTSKSKDQDLSKWIVRRKVDNQPDLVYQIPDGTQLNSGRNIKIFANNCGSHNPPQSLVADHLENWGIGMHVITRLLNDVGEEKATHVQKTIYS
ncbi:hypothetical protein SNEBB_007567 [Seison nebaliae]|nr:hypothetical protein SNEBB_007567 [Seison nebaliae]